MKRYSRVALHLGCQVFILLYMFQAVTRCTFCLLNLCLFCSDSHKRQRVSSEHEMVSLVEAGKQDASGVTAIRRQLMCGAHPDKELTLYCTACQQLVCR